MFGVLTATLLTVAASIIVAIVVAAVFAPMVLRLRAQGRSRTAAAGVVWVTAIVVILVIGLLLVLAFLPYLGDVATSLEAGVTELQTQAAALDLPEFVGTLASELVGAIRSEVSSSGDSIVARAGEFVTILILATFLFFYFLRDGDKAWMWVFQAVSDRKREHITAAGDDALARVGGYLRGTTVLAAITAGTAFLFMWWLGVPLAGPLAVIVFLGGYVPYIGGFVATILVLLATLSAVGTNAAIVMLVLIVIRSAIVGYGIRPTVYGRTVSIHPALALIVLPIGFELGGVIGLFAAVPVTAVVLAVSGAVTEILEPETSPSLPNLVPAWLDRTAQFSLRILLVIALVALLISIALTVPLALTPIVLGLVFSATLAPLVRELVQRGRSRSSAVAIVVVGGFLGIAAIIILATISLVEQAQELGDTATSGADSVNAALDGQAELGAQAIDEGAATTVQAIITAGEALGTVIVICIFTTLLTFYFLRDGASLWRRIIAHAGGDISAEIQAAATRAFDVLGGYMIGTAAISFVGAASQWLIMVLLGLPLALPVFVLSFFLGFIPYIGGFLATLIAFLVAVAAGTQSDVVVMAIWTLVFNIVSGNIVAPAVYGRTVHIHPAIVLVSIPAASAIAGIMGMFLVVPAIGVVATTWRTGVDVLGARRGMPVEAPPPVPDLADQDVPTDS